MFGDQDNDAIKQLVKSDIGGLSSIIDHVLDLIFGFYKNSDNSNFGLSRHVLIQGRSGIGKTALVSSIVKHLNIDHKIINSTYVFQQDEGDTEKLLNDLFSIGQENRDPFVLVFEEIDTIALNRSDNQIGYIEKRVSSYLMNLLEQNNNLKTTQLKRPIFIIGITSRIETMDHSFFSFGKFDSVIQIPIPSPIDRQDILYLYFQKFPSFKRNIQHYQDLAKYIGQCTHGYVGSDLNHLCKEAILLKLKNKPLKATEKCNDDGDDDNTIIEQHWFDKAFGNVRPSILNQYKMNVDMIRFEDIGGMDEIIEKIKSSILTPIMNKELIERLGIQPPSGILLYGPSGNGKSLIARAIASSSPNINFISIQSTDIIDPVVGASEKNLSRLFKVLRESSPCILFIDQVEVLAKVRGFDSSTEQTSDRLLSCLLTEIDGISHKGSGSKSIILAATTRIDMLDPSILRPGRFDYHIHIPNPSLDSRIDILKKLTAKMPTNLTEQDYRDLCVQTDGFSGADLNNLCKETALSALRSDINIQTLDKSNFLNTLCSIKRTPQS